MNTTSYEASVALRQAVMAKFHQTKKATILTFYKHIERRGQLIDSIPISLAEVLDVPRSSGDTLTADNGKCIVLTSRRRVRQPREGYAYYEFCYAR